MGDCQSRSTRELEASRAQEEEIRRLAREPLSTLRYLPEVAQHIETGDDELFWLSNLLHGAREWVDRDSKLLVTAVLRTWFEFEQADVDVKIYKTNVEKLVWVKVCYGPGRVSKADPKNLVKHFVTVMTKFDEGDVALSPGRLLTGLAEGNCSKKDLKRVRW